MKIRRLFHLMTWIPNLIIRPFWILFNRLNFWSSGVSYGNNLRIYNRFFLKVLDNTNCTIGDNFLITSGDFLNPISRNICGSLFVTSNAVLTIGNNVSMSSPHIRCSKSVTIGDNVMFGALVCLLDTDSHHIDYLDRRSEGKFNADDVNCAPIVIGDDVWIGANTIILKGVSIGARSIIGANSVVTRDIASDCIAAGNPCKVIKTLK